MSKTIYISLVDILQNIGLTGKWRERFEKKIVKRWTSKLIVDFTSNNTTKELVTLLDHFGGRCAVYGAHPILQYKNGAFFFKCFV